MVSAVFDLTLSFDNGPTPDITPLVLDVLARRGFKSTFFVIGEKLGRHRALAERAHAEGHWIGNHTWSHSLPFGLMAADAASAAAQRNPKAAASQLLREVLHSRRLCKTRRPARLCHGHAPCQSRLLSLYGKECAGRKGG